MKSAWLVLEDGKAFKGRSVGADGEIFGEVVFNTSITGYQEILTDPSYKGQIVCMTYPHIGNYGVNDEDVESRRSWVEGFIMRQLSPIASNFRSQESLDSYLKRRGIVAIDGIDTRALTLVLRESGSMKGGISSLEQDPRKLLDRVRVAPDIVGRDLVKEVTCEKPYDWDPNDSSELQVAGSESIRKPKTENRNFHVVVMDFGVKYNILRELSLLGCYITVVPASTSAADILSRNPDGILLSNGPGDPEGVAYAADTIRKLLKRVPMLGICLGHQLLCRALGGETMKLKFGHHGGNHPVQNLGTGKVEITSQNHNFAVRMESIMGEDVMLTHRNLNDGTVEGIRHKRLPVFGIQYHPEASPGPHDARPFFQQFIDLMSDGAKASGNR